MKQEVDFPNVLYLYFEIISLNPLGNESIVASAGFTTFHALGEVILLVQVSAYSFDH